MWCVTVLCPLPFLPPQKRADINKKNSAHSSDYVSNWGILLQMPPRMLKCSFCRENNEHSFSVVLVFKIWKWCYICWGGFMSRMSICHPDILKCGTYEGTFPWKQTNLTVIWLIWNVAEYFGTSKKTRQVHASLKCMLILSLTCMELWSWSHCTGTSCEPTFICRHSTTSVRRCAVKTAWEVVHCILVFPSQECFCLLCFVYGGISEP